MASRIRRTLARALSKDEGEKRALIDRILPRGEGGKRVLRLEKEDDRQLLPLAIVAALSADAITGDEAEELTRQVKNVAVSKPRLWEDNCPPELLALNPLERLRLGYAPPPGPKYPPWRNAAKTGAAIVNNNENTMAVAGDLATGQKPNPL